MNTPVPEPGELQLADFLEHLRRHGFKVGVDQPLRIAELLKALERNPSPEELPGLLSPLFARSAAEQQRFRQAWDRFYHPLPAPALQAPERRRPRRWVRRLVVAIGLLLVAGAAAGGYQLLASWWPLAPPAELRAATPARSTHVDLTWQDRSQGEQRFLVEREETRGRWRLLARAPANSRQYRDTAVIPATTYRYRVAAVAGRRRPSFSNELSVRTADIDPVSRPPAPRRLRLAEPAATSAVRLAWSYGDSNADSFEIERRDTGDPAATWQVMDSVPADSQGYDDVAVASGARYLYRIAAANAGGRSGYSNELRVSVPEVRGGRPGAPGDLRAAPTRTQPDGTAEVDLAWRDRSSDETGFQVERATDGGAFQAVTTLLPGTEAFSDRAPAAPPVQYHDYRVIALKGAVASPPSNVARASISRPTAVTASWQPTRLERFWEAVRYYAGPAVAGGALLLMLLGALAVARWRAERAAVRAAQRERWGPTSWPMPLPPPTAWAPEWAPAPARVRIWDPDRLREAARLLRRRQPGESPRLDVPATIGATIRSLGYPQLRYHAGSRPPEHLFLIERRSPWDHQARLFAGLARALRREGVHGECGFYEGDPRLCWMEGPREHLDLADLASRFPGHRLVVLGSTEALAEPFSGAPATWVAELARWAECAVLHPGAPPRPALRRSLARDLVLLPATLAGLTALGEHYEAPVPRATEWPADDPDPLEISTADPRLVERLRAGLGAPLFRWLCACAIYPELRWELTLHLGALETLRTGLLTGPNILRLSRLSWFRDGSIPDDARMELMRQLDAPTQAAVREAILALLDNYRARPPAGSFAADARRLDLAVQRWLLRRDRSAKRELREAMRALPASELLRDGTVPRLLAAPRASLAGMLPGGLRHALFRYGMPLLGLKTAPLLLVPAFLLAGGGLVWRIGWSTAAPPELSSLEVRPSVFPGGEAAQATVKLDRQAPTGGVRISLSATNPALAGPRSITVEADKAAAVFALTTERVAAPVAVTLRAALGRRRLGVPLRLLQPGALQIVSLIAAPPAVSSGAPARLLLRLSRRAPAEGAEIRLASDNAAVSFDAAAASGSVMIRSGASRADVPLRTSLVPTETRVTFTATLAATGQARQATLLLFGPDPARLASETVDPAATRGGSPVTVTVSLSRAAPPGGASLRLTSDNRAARFGTTDSAALTVPAGARSAALPLTTTQVRRDTPVTLAANLGTDRQTAVLRLLKGPSDEDIAAWNRAADLTNAAAAGQNWENAARAWKEVAERGVWSPAEQAEATLQAVSGYLEAADFAYPDLIQGAQSMLNGARSVLAAHGSSLAATLNGSLDRRIEHNLSMRPTGDQPGSAMVDAWNQAARATRGAYSSADWSAAADLWAQATMMRGSTTWSEDERRRIALYRIRCLLKQADTLKAQSERGNTNTSREEEPGRTPVPVSMVQEGGNRRPTVEAALDRAAQALKDLNALLSPADRASLSRVIGNNRRALAGAVRLIPATLGAVAPYRGGPIGPARAGCAILQYYRPHQPDVAEWLDRLRNEPQALRRLVDWFNNGMVTRATTESQVKRDFSADEKSPDYLVAFLSSNLQRTPGVVRRGTRAWCDRDGKVWEPEALRTDMPAYFLNNGVALVEAERSRPLNVIRWGRVEWINTDIGRVPDYSPAVRWIDTPRPRAQRYPPRATAPR